MSPANFSDPRKWEKIWRELDEKTTKRTKNLKQYKRANGAF